MSTYAPSVEQITDGNGKPIVGARKHFFEIGTTTFKTIYSDPALTTPLTNPIKSDADGRYPTIYLDGLYKVVQEDNSGTDLFLLDGVTLWTEEQVGESPSTTQFALWDTTATYNIPDIVLGSDDNYYRSLTDTNTGNNPTTTATSWEQLIFGREWNTNVTYAVGDVVYGTDGLLYTSRTAANLGNDPTTDLVNWNGKIQHDTVASALNTVKVTDSASGNQVKIQGVGEAAGVGVIIEGTGTNSSVDINTNGTGEVNKNSVPVYGMVILDTPEVLVNASAILSTWTTVNSTTLNTAGAKKAILRVISQSDNTSTLVSTDGYLRKTGSGLAAGSQTQVTIDKDSAPSSTGLFARSTAEATINLDANSDFDWYQTFTGSGTTTIILVGYYT